MARSNELTERFAIIEGLCDKREEERSRNIDAVLEEFCREDDDGDACVERCDRCGQSTLLCGDLVTTRDIDEGMHGPVYHVCKKCYGRQQAALQAEFEERCRRLGLTPAQAVADSSFIGS